LLNEKIDKAIEMASLNTLVYVDDLEKEFDDPISHFTKITKQMALEVNQDSIPLNFSFSSNETIDSNFTCIIYDLP
jgi:hypothetical protein